MDEMRSADKINRYILVVVTNTDERLRMSTLLQLFGYNICTAQTAAVCLAP